MTKPFNSAKISEKSIFPAILRDGRLSDIALPESKLYHNIAHPRAMFPGRQLMKKSFIELKPRFFSSEKSNARFISEVSDDFPSEHIGEIGSDDDSIRGCLSEIVYQGCEEITGDSVQGGERRVFHTGKVFSSQIKRIGAYISGDNIDFPLERMSERDRDDSASCPDVGYRRDMRVFLQQLEDVSYELFCFYSRDKRTSIYQTSMSTKYDVSITVFLGKIRHTEKNEYSLERKIIEEAFVYPTVHLATHNSKSTDWVSAVLGSRYHLWDNRHGDQQ